MKNNIIAIIPARGGSKGVPDKNIKLLKGYPLIAYSIIAAKCSSKIQRTIVSTDSEKITKIALSYGAEVPFLRPKEIAKDTSLDIEYVRHTLKWLQDNEEYLPEYIIQLRPTTPLRDPILIDKAIEKILDNKKATSLRSAHETSESPYKFFKIENGFFAGLFPNDPRPEYYDLPRQVFPPIYHPNGYVDITKTETVLNADSLYGSKILPFITPVVGELDCPKDFEHIEFILHNKRNKVYEFLKNKFPLGKNE